MRRFAALIICLLVLLSSCHFMGVGGGGEPPEQILKVAVQYEMRTRNILNTNDIWTSHVIWQCYDTVLKIDPDTEALLPFILVGTETNGVPGLQDEEKGVFDFLPSSTEDIAAYYDFTDVRFHDGEQVDVMDIIFSYHILALHPNWYRDISPLMDKGSISGNYSTDRWLWIWDEDDGDGNPLTSVLRFHLEAQHHRLWMNTMNIPILPQHVWEGTGGGIHEDFGYAIDANGIGVPIDHPTLEEFDLLTKAMDWEPEDDEVIGTGMFFFEEFIKDSHSKVITNEDYLEIEIGDISIHPPYIDGIVFIKFSSTQQATMALRKGEVDVIIGDIPPDFLPELQKDANIAIISSVGQGIHYLAYNMRTAVFGYPNNDPQQGDWGEPLRKAIAHLTDKRMMVDIYLQGYGSIGNSPVSPWDTFWYNNSVPTYDFNPILAESIMDTNNLIDTDGDGWRDTDITIPGDQDDVIGILAPTPNYCPYRAQACIVLEENMREAGLNATCSLGSFGVIMDAIDKEEFDMVMLGWHMGDTDPTGYLHSLFHSDSSANIAGYQSKLFDQVIIEALQETDLTKRQLLVKWAQGIAVEDLPLNVLFYKKNIEAYRHDRFISWVIYKGTIFNYWSLMNIGSRPSTDKYLRVVPVVASAVSSNKTATIMVTVRDQDRAIVEDAIVNISVDMGVIQTEGKNHGDSWEGHTNINGQVIVSFLAPYVYNPNGLKVTITLRAFKENYDESGIRSVFITVFPPEVKFLSVTMEFEYGDLINEGEKARVDVTVRDENYLPVDGAHINITTALDLEVVPRNGTTSNGGKLENIVITAPDVEYDRVFWIEATPSKLGYKGVSAIVELTVLDLEDGSQPHSPFPIFWILIFLIIFFAVASVLTELRKSREKRKE